MRWFLLYHQKMSLKQRIINKAIEVERVKILQQFAQDPVNALADLLSRCGIQFSKKGSIFEIEISHQEQVIISVQKKVK